MGQDSAIQWTDHTFSPWHGCEKVSPACAHCYAEAISKRIGQRIWGRDAPRRFLSDNHWKQPRKWNEAAHAAGVPAKVFCASMADVFEDREDLIPHRARLFDLIESTPHLTWQLLTKRPEMVMHHVPVSWEKAFPANVWMGTTVEDQRRANERIPYLLDVPARVRFLSMEPLLGAVDLTDIRSGCGHKDGCDSDVMSAFCGYSVCDHGHGQGLRRGINWVIAGCESRGSHAGRPTNEDWLRSLRDQCSAANVPFFLKQTSVDGKIDHAPTLDGRTHLAFPGGSDV